MFFKTKSRRAKDLLSGAYKVYNFRRDAMPREAAEKMLSLIDELEELIDDGKISEARYGELEQELEALMRKHGGKIYPRLRGYGCRSRDNRPGHKELFSPAL